MNTISRFLILFLGAMLSFAAAQNVPPPRPVEPPRASGGLTVQLTTSAHKVLQPKADATGESRTSIAAFAILANRSDAAVSFTFPDGASAEAKFEFSLTDKEGNEVWRSDDGVGVAALTTLELRRGASWKRIVRVPLIIDGAPISPGLYSLIAFTDADKKVSAQTVLEISARPDEPTRGKITGSVVKVLTPATDATPETTEPAAGAWVTVQQIFEANAALARPFQWQGRADDAGLFSVEVPAGKFRVTAGLNNVIERPAGGVVEVLPPPVFYPPKSVVVAVAAGQTVEAKIKLTPQVVQPPVAQGIRGKVVQPLPPEAAAAPGERPVAGARIEVTAIAADPVLGANALPFRWTGVTNAEGRFEVRTPPGKYLVVATKVLENVVQPAIFPPLPLPVLKGRAEVSVSAGAFSEVKISVALADSPVIQAR